MNARTAAIISSSLPTQRRATCAPLTNARRSATSATFAITGSTQSDLAKRSGKDKAQLTRLIAGLRERGLPQGEANLDDGA